MAYIGNVPAEKYTALTQQTFSSPTGTSFTLSQAVTNSVDIDLYIDNVKQNPASYSVSGTSLTTSTISSPSTMYCLFNGRTTETVNPPDDSVGLSQMASATDGNLITFDASGNPAYVATGNDGQVLTSAGAGQPCLFEDAAAGGSWTLIGTAVASTSATLTQTGLASTYGTYAIAFSAMRPSTTAQPWLRFGESDGIDSGSDHYRWYVSSHHETRFDDSAAEIELAHQDGVASTSSFSAMLYLQTQESSGASSNIHGTGHTTTIDGGQHYAHRMGGVRDDLITLDRIQFSFSTGTITSGRMTVWGLAHA